VTGAGAAEPLEQAAGAALAGRLVVFPTDTVYGIGTRPDDERATARLFEAKARARELELPVLVPSASAAREIAVFDERADALVLRFWSGPLTIVLPRTARSGPWDLGGDPETIGVRMPNHPLSLALLARTGPLAATSANRSGEATPDACGEIEAVFGDRIEVYLCEEAPRSGRASTVLDLAHGQPRLLRSGSVTESDVLAVLAGGGPGEGRV
jgi:tRNA threonylcarbamoyl adenosine modification protein (Sua5/YciO/YrdC/YwlC family)